ncbi:MAG TPA: hypothetical protein EYO33_23045 [Phycisphaerales bacterium]|nr:hypothetical protein [Phycisphaerales bacterium]
MKSFTLGSNGTSGQEEQTSAATIGLTSGRYESQPSSSNLPLGEEILRLDIDGSYPQMTASGTVTAGLSHRVHWIASLQRNNETFEGAIWYKEGGQNLFPYTDITIRPTQNRGKIEVDYRGSSGPGMTRSFEMISKELRDVEFEYDSVEGTDAVTTLDVHAHPNRPTGLRAETLSIEDVFQRAGFSVTKSGGDNILPITGAGTNGSWSDLEMHDAMQRYWSRFANRSQWSLWALFAALHDDGDSLGGIMFDDIGPNHRQGTAIFNSSFIARAPYGETHPDAWVERMKFWCAIHEMGHAFNLAHSWQKELGSPWIPTANEFEERSFMNYPYNVRDGERAFFRNFEYRFSDSELLFMRHAPERFVQMGNAAWFDHHGFQQAKVARNSPFSLELRANRPTLRFEFLEPPLLEVKLTNHSDEPQIIPDQLLKMREQMTIILKRRGDTAKQFIPYSRYCYKTKNKVLNPGESVYESLFVAAGVNGWALAEPGKYLAQLSLKMPSGSDLVSNQLFLNIDPPVSREEEIVAQDFFTEDVGRVLRFEGTRELKTAHDTLQLVSEKFPERRVALHALAALGNPLTKSYKELVLSNSGQPEEIRQHQPQPEDALKTMEPLLTKSDSAAETLGHIDYKNTVDRLSKGLVQADSPNLAAEAQGALHNALSNRGVLTGVLKDIDKTRKAYLKK